MVSRHTDVRVFPQPGHVKSWEVCLASYLATIEAKRADANHMASQTWVKHPYLALRFTVSKQVFEAGSRSV
jgi:hypothetical protein